MLLLPRGPLAWGSPRASLFVSWVKVSFQAQVTYPGLVLPPFCGQWGVVPLK